MDLPFESIRQQLRNDIFKAETDLKFLEREVIDDQCKLHFRTPWVGMCPELERKKRRIRALQQHLYYLHVQLFTL